MQPQLAMWKCERTDGVKGRREDGVKERRGDAAIPVPRLRVSPSPLLPVVLLLAGLLVTGCRRDMQDQPKMKPYRGTTFFADGLSGRQPIQGTVPRGFLREDTEYFTGKKSVQSVNANNATPGTFPDDTDTFPFPVTEDTVRRCRE